jgi:hypothetical protein
MPVEIVVIRHLDFWLGLAVGDKIARNAIVAIANIRGQGKGVIH